MKRFLSLLIVLTSCAVAAPEEGRHDYIERFDTLYNSLTVQRRGSVVELRARSRGSEALESAVDLEHPLDLQVPYTRTLFSALFIKPNPRRVLMIGLGGAGFHRVFADAFPEALLQTVELDPKVYELCQTHLGFKPTERTPVAVMDGRMFVKRDRQAWDWLVLDAFRGGFVPPHLKTEEFYRECAARLSDGGVFVTNLHSGNRLYASDLRTIRKVFPHVVLFGTPDRGNVIACAVKRRTASIEKDSTWPSADELTRILRGHVDMAEIKGQRMALPVALMAKAPVLTDDFAPVEFLDSVKTNNTDER